MWTVFASDSFSGSAGATLSVSFDEARDDEAVGFTALLAEVAAETALDTPVTDGAGGSDDGTTPEDAETTGWSAAEEAEGAGATMLDSTGGGAPLEAGS